MTYTEGVSFRPFLMYKRIDSFPTVQYFLIKCSIRTPFRRTKLNLPPPHDFSLFEVDSGKYSSGLSANFVFGVSHTKCPFNFRYKFNPSYDIYCTIEHSNDNRCLRNVRILVVFQKSCVLFDTDTFLDKIANIYCVPIRIPDPSSKDAARVQF